MVNKYTYTHDSEIRYVVELKKGGILYLDKDEYNSIDLNNEYCFRYYDTPGAGASLLNMKDCEKDL